MPEVSVCCRMQFLFPPPLHKALGVGERMVEIEQPEIATVRVLSCDTCYYRLRGHNSMMCSDCELNFMGNVMSRWKPKTIDLTQPKH